MATSGTPLSFGEVLRLRPVRRLWIAQIVSVFGDFLAVFAIIALVTFKLHGTATQVAMVLVSFMAVPGIQSEFPKTLRVSRKPRRPDRLPPIHPGARHHGGGHSAGRRSRRALHGYEGRAAQPHRAGSTHRQRRHPSGGSGFVRRDLPGAAPFADAGDLTGESHLRRGFPSSGLSH
jgi:hypothetical protein